MKETGFEIRQVWVRVPPSPPCDLRQVTLHVKVSPSVKPGTSSYYVIGLMGDKIMLKHGARCLACGQHPINRSCCSYCLVTLPFHPDSQNSTWCRGTLLAPSSWKELPPCFLWFRCLHRTQPSHLQPWKAEGLCFACKSQILTVNGFTKQKKSQTGAGFQRARRKD